MQKGMGWIKDPVDARDYNVRQLLVPTAVAVTLPMTFTVYPETIIYDQGQTPRCVAYAMSGIKTDEEFVQWGERHQFNPDWLYAECKKIDGIPTQGGTYPRIACQVVQKQGIPLVKRETCFFKKVETNNPDLKWKIDSYYRIDATNSETDIKQILYSYGSFMAASEWFSNWSTKFSIFPEPAGGSQGGHAYRIIGWDTTGWVVANSWGTILWGINGRATMPYNIFRDHVLPEGDCWKIIDAK